MDAEQAIYERLTADEDLEEVIGTRLYADQCPDSEALPLVIYREAGSVPSYSLAGLSGSGLLTFRFECYAATRAAAKAAREAIRSSLSGYAGTIGGGAVRVHGAFDEGGEGGVSAPVLADEFGVYRAGLDVRVFHGPA